MPVIVFSGPSTLATFVAVYALFGPTFPGIYDESRGVYTLFYPVCITKITTRALHLHLLLCASFVGLLDLCTIRDYPLLSQYHLNIQVAAKMEKVCLSYI